MNVDLLFSRHLNQQQWIIRATNGNGIIHCKTREETLQTLKVAFQVKYKKKNSEQKKLKSSFRIKYLVKQINQ
jgi:hypothetical protein